MDAIIVGAGIAGSASALFLKRAGVEPIVYEARSIAEQAAGQFLTVAPNGLRVLDELGLGGRVRLEGLMTPALKFRSADGRPLGEVAIGAGSEVAYTIKRATLVRILHAALERSDIAVNFNMKLQEVTGPQFTTAHFTYGHVAKCDVLLGCDGVHSQVRRAIVPDAPDPRDTGLVSCGGFAYCPSLAATPDGMRMVYGRRGFFGYIIGVGGEVFWFSTFRDAEITSAPPTTRDWQRFLLELHDQDGDTVRTILGNVSRRINAFTISDIPALECWTRGSAVLVGDAAHATSPHGGQGASLALEDAWVLSESLRLRDKTSPVADALKQFQLTRKNRVEKIVTWSRRNGAAKSMESALARRLRDAFMPLALRWFGRPSAHGWVYDFKLGTSEQA